MEVDYISSPLTAYMKTRESIASVRTLCHLHGGTAALGDITRVDINPILQHLEAQVVNIEQHLPHRHHGSSPLYELWAATSA